MELLKVNLEKPIDPYYSWNVICISQIKDFNVIFLQNIKNNSSVKEIFDKTSYNTDSSFAIRQANGDIIGCVLMSDKDILESKYYVSEVENNKACYNINAIILDESLIKKKFIYDFVERLTILLFGLHNSDENPEKCTTIYLWYDYTSICVNGAFNNLNSLDTLTKREFLTDEILRLSK